MREIRFRGKRVDNGEWVHGSFRLENEKAYILEDKYSVIVDEPEYHICGMGCGLEDRGITDRYDAMAHGWDKAIDRFFEQCPPWDEVIPETVGQYTGLKDKNGVEIYEGDVVHCWGGESRQGFHEYDTDITVDDEYQLRCFEIQEFDEYYIIGNIHDKAQEGQEE